MPPFSPSRSHLTIPRERTKPPLSSSLPIAPTSSNPSLPPSFLQTHTDPSPLTHQCTAINLLQSGTTNILILEKSAGLGGTWRDNRYPGCCCDVWSHLYSFSFDQNPSWTREYPGQEEILSYLQGVAHKYELYRYIRFNTSVTEARWDEGKGKWGVQVEVSGGKEREFVGEEGGYRIESDYLVSAVGQLNVPRLPDIEGLEGYKGKVMHSARWDWTYGLEGKRAAIIGELISPFEVWCQRAVNG